MRRLAPTLALALALGLAACGGDDGEDEGAAAPGTTPAAPGTATQEGTAAECEQVQAPAPKPDGGAEEPSEELDPAKTYEVTVQTSCGAFTITLDVESAPETTASFVSLAEQGFYDDTVFHRIVPGFVIQGGDPTGTGTGGPGYQTVDEPPADASYTRGVVAMAKAGDEAPGTSGSQFFVVTGEDAGLPPDFAILGEVSGGLAVVEAIGQLGDPATEQPLQPIVIEGMELEVS